MPSHGEVGAHEWPVTAGTDRPVAIGTRTVDNSTAKPSTETGPRRLGAWLHGDQCPERVGSCSRGAAPESGGDCPDEARKRAVGPTRIARRWGSPSVSGAAQGVSSATPTPTAWQNAGSPSAPNGCAMTALRPPRRGACRAVSFTSASASLAPTVGNGRRRSTTERRHKTEPNFCRRRNNDDRHADC